MNNSFAKTLRPWANIGAIAPVIILLTTIALYFVTRKILHIAAHSDLAQLIVMLGLLATATKMRSVRYADIPSFLALFIRCLGVAVFGQVIFDAINVSPGTPNLFSVTDNPLVSACIFLALISGYFSLTRPAFLFPLQAFYLMFRLTIGERSGIEVVPTDYLSMLESGIFCVLGAFCVFHVMRGGWDQRVRSYLPGAETLDYSAIGITASTYIWAVAVGAHLRNYFYSGVAKLQAGWPHPETWLLQNPTQNSILIGLERGDNPLSRYPEVLGAVSDFIAGGGVFVNLLVLGAQLLAPLGAFHKRLLLVLTIFYDIFHIGVYFTLGALFFFWIIVNLLIFATAVKLPDKRITLGMTIIILLTIVGGGRAFYTNRLGWLDAAKLASPHFLAITKEGRQVEIPGPYFGLFSYNIAQGILYLPPGSFPQRVGGNTKSLAEWQDSRTCGPMVATTPQNDVQLASVVNLVKVTDGYARRHPWFKDWNTYYFYPHHMVPNPAEFAAFNRLRIGDITGYVYRVDSVCLTLDHGRLKRDVRKSWQVTIPASGAVGPT